MELAGIEPSLVLEDADEQTQDELAGILVEEVLEGGRTESTSAIVSAFAARRRGGAYTGTLNVSSSSGGGDNLVRTSSYVRIMLGRKDGMKDSNDRQQRVKGLPDPTTSPGSAAAVRGPSIAVQQTEPVAVLLHAGDGSICLGIALVVRCFVKGKEVPSLRDDEMVTTSAVELEKINGPLGGVRRDAEGDGAQRWSVAAQPNDSTDASEDDAAPERGGVGAAPRRRAPRAGRAATPQRRARRAVPRRKVAADGSTSFRRGTYFGAGPFATSSPSSAARAPLARESGSGASPPLSPPRDEADGALRRAMASATAEKLHELAAPARALAPRLSAEAEGALVGDVGRFLRGEVDAVRGALSLFALPLRRLPPSLLRCSRHEAHARLLPPCTGV